MPTTLAREMTNPNPCAKSMAEIKTLTPYQMVDHTRRRVGFHLILASAKLPSCQLANRPAPATAMASATATAPASSSCCSCSSSCSATCSRFVFVVLIYSGTGFIYRRCFWLHPTPISIPNSICICSSHWAPCCVIYASGGWLPAQLSRCPALCRLPASSTAVAF